MIIVKIIGGLGNQMFQYSYAKMLQKNGHEVKIDISAFDTYRLHGGYQLYLYKIDLLVSSKEENLKFNKYKIKSKILKKIGFKSKNIIEEETLLFHEELLNIRDDTYIMGYFQSEKYFQNIRNTLVRQFILSRVSTYTEKMRNHILSSTLSCSIHIRRGDFTNAINMKVHGVCDNIYYEKAMKYIEKKYLNMHYFVFSDDIDWVKKNMKINNATYIDNIKERFPHEDIYLMSLCKNNIIANSSFSWWGAWLNQEKEKIVIAPKRWFTDRLMNTFSHDIYSNEWIRL